MFYHVISVECCSTINSKKTERSFEINLDFLNESKVYEMTSFEDGINAQRQSMDHRKRVSQVRNGEILLIKMVRNGGWAVVIQ